MHAWFVLILPCTLHRDEWSTGNPNDDRAPPKDSALRLRDPARSWFTAQ